jgi:hypothetical protein
MSTILTINDRIAVMDIALKMATQSIKSAPLSNVSNQANVISASILAVQFYNDLKEGSYSLSQLQEMTKDLSV